MRYKQYMRHFHLDQPEKTAVAEHITDTGHSMKFNNICRLIKVQGYMDHLVKEAIEIQLHPNNFNRDGGFMLSRTWQPLLQQVWNTYNENLGQIQHSGSIHYLLGHIQLWTRPQYGYISRQIECRVISQNAEDGDNVSLWNVRVFDLSGTAVSVRRFYWSSFYVKALSLELCISSCWFFKVFHPCCALDSKNHGDSVEHSNSVIQYQLNNKFWSIGPLSGWQNWKIHYTILNGDWDLSFLHIFIVYNRVELRNFI